MSDVMIPVQTEPQKGPATSDVAYLRREGDDLILEWWDGQSWVTFGPMPEPES